MSNWSRSSGLWRREIMWSE